MSYFYTKEELDDIKALTDHLEENYEDIYEQSDLIESIIEILKNNFTYSSQELRNKVSKLSNKDKILCDIVQDIAFDVAVSITEKLDEIKEKCLENLD